MSGSSKSGTKDQKGRSRFKFKKEAHGRGSKQASKEGKGGKSGK